MGNGRVAVVIPAYKVSKHILDVLSAIGPEISSIFVVDDACPEGSGKLVATASKDKRVKVLFHAQNQGVGGAVTTGYKAALASGAEIVVKVDGDGQMDPHEIPNLIRPIIQGRADYAKGNRFDSIEDLEGMPLIRVLGNAALSLISKISTGYWNITDPTNGFTAIHRFVLNKIDLDRLRKNYFFESDMLFRLSTIRAVVFDVSIPAKYGDEESNLRISRVLVEFPWRYLVNFIKRIFYRYYLREWTVASIELPVGFLMMVFGIGYGISKLIYSSTTGVPTSAGTVMISVLPIIVGFQLSLAFINYDVSNIPNRPRQLES